MNRFASAVILTLFALLALLPAACAGESASEGELAIADSGAQPEQELLPEGHPPIDSAPPPSGIVAPPPGSGSGATGMTWSAPGDWISETPSSAMRRAQYRVPGAAGDGECVVYYFGPGQGGGAEANAERWAGQFAQPDGSPSSEAMQAERFEVGGVPVLLVEVTGTYNGGMAMMGGAPELRPDYMLLGAIAEGPDANWFFKLTGPEATLRPQRDAFEEMIRSLRAGA